ncbi:efflux RND transporter periplasmic adaptor subunit [Zavarzinella formosa]|uniref:efflux RND transporter periplasmic adaptor subunit n=1 Tax=Zavarzinella formosa TaxID=360055 RepID=UPI000305D16F|nr:biotin/lipoyl-binding protein [Zavarzinella formosa]
MVTVERPVERTLDTYYEFTGYLRAAREVEVRAQVTGYLKTIHFKEGRLVKGGDVLYEIDSEPYEAALLSARANLAAAVASLQKLTADVITAEERYALAKVEYERQSKLAQTGAVSQSDFDKTQSLFKTTTSEVSAAKANRDSQTAVRDSASAALRKAEFDRNNCVIRLSAKDITAPENLTMNTSGGDIQARISRTLITEGNLVLSGQTVLCKVVSLNPMYGYWDIDEMTSLAYRKLIYDDKTLPDPRLHALKCWIGGKSDTGYPHEGYVNYIAPEISRGTASREVRGVFPNPDHRLSPGDSIRIKAEAGPPMKKVTIPEIAVGIRQQQKFVYVVVQKEGKEIAEFRPIVAGPVREVNGVRLQVIEQGLSVKDMVVVNGLLRVRPGAPVTATEQSSPVSPK